MPGESVIPVEKGEIHEDKHSVHLKEPLFVNHRNPNKTEKGVLDESGISNIAEAGSTIDEGADKEKVSQIEALEQFPTLHPHRNELHVELYKKFQML